MLNSTLLPDAERVVRVTLIFILLTAGISTFFTAGGFFDYFPGVFCRVLPAHAPWTRRDSVTG